MKGATRTFSKPPAITGACHCGAVQLEALRVPRQVTDCNCTICRRYGALWAYFTVTTARVIAPRAATRIYRRRPNGIAFHHCVRCGCLTHYAIERRLALNARMFPPAQLAGAEVRRLDGWDVIERAPFTRFVAPH